MLQTNNVPVAEEAAHGETQTLSQRRRPFPLIWLLAMGLLLAVIAAAVLWLARGRQPVYGLTVQSTAPAVDFTLDSSLGRPVSLGEFRGKYVLLYFGYTTCPDVCPTTLADLRQMMAALGDQRELVQVLFVTVDPDRDTPERLATYLGHFDPSFIGLTGSVARLQEIASAFGVFFARVEGATAADYLMEHTSTVIGVDGEGYVRLLFPYGIRGQQMADDLRTQLR